MRDQKSPPKAREAPRTHALPAYGGQGADTIYGDEFDRLFGNLGADVFVTAHPETVADFDAEQGDIIVPLLGRHIPDNHEWMGV